MPSLYFAPAALSLMFAAEAHADTAFKVGYVDMQGALPRLDEAKRESAKLKKEFESRQKKLDDMQTDLKKMKEDFDKQLATLRDEVKAKRQGDMQSKLNELQQTYLQLQQELGEKQQAFTRDIFGKMKTIVEKVGDRDGYQLILDRSDALVLYFKRHTDITDEVVVAYNSAHK